MIIEPSKPLTKKVEIKTYMTMIYCSHCGAPLRPHEEVLCTNPPRYQYNCPKCGLESFTTHENFPKISYEEVETTSNSEDPSRS